MKEDVARQIPQRWQVTVDVQKHSGRNKQRRWVAARGSVSAVEDLERWWKEKKEKRRGNRSRSRSLSCERVEAVCDQLGKGYEEHECTGKEVNIEKNSLSEES